MNAATRPTIAVDAPRGARRNGSVLIGAVAVLLALLIARVLVGLIAAEAAVPAVAAPLSAPSAAAPRLPAALPRPALQRPAPPDSGFGAPEVDPHLLAEVARRQAVLDRREQALETRAAQVAAAEKLARQEIAVLSRLRSQLEQMLNSQQKAADADLGVLVGLYRNMKPQQAAAVLGKLDPSSAAAILEQLDTREAGPIVAAMDPNAALALTQALEKRRAAFRH